MREKLFLRLLPHGVMDIYSSYLFDLYSFFQKEEN
ncbi:hypothetical protein A4157S3_540064 [Escherichia coli]|nr:hypothetical protein A4157S3_540064 [Escherichia coli]SOQ84060.1 hypothetical protein DSM301R_690066 [Escherichia coli]SOQ86334.1 hypothetical protein NCTC86R_170063 [Escherichia coli]SOQ94067.1 hypothetical protein NC86S2_1050004 [Escherichia coli]SOQ95216.1 hypothetical protein NC86S1_890066 [Escherichia coli]